MDHYIQNVLQNCQQKIFILTSWLLAKCLHEQRNEVTQDLSIANSMGGSIYVKLFYNPKPSMGPTPLTLFISFVMLRP